MRIDTSAWKIFKFGDIALNLKATVKDPLSEGFERYVGLEHILPENIHIKSWGKISDGTTFTRVFRKGQVLFGKRRAYQKKAAIAEFDGVCSGDIMVFQANEEYLISELLPFITQSDKFFNYAIKTSAGSLSPRTKYKDLAKLKFKLPTLEEQKRLAHLLWSVDKTITVYKTLLSNKLLMRSVILKNIFLNKTYKTTKINELPIKEINGMWKTVETKDVIQASIIRSTEIKPFGEISYNTAQKHIVKKSKFDDKKLIPGDIIIERSGGGPDQPVGRVCYFNESDGNYTFSNFMSAVRIHNYNKVLPKYLFYFLLFFYEMKGTNRLQKQTTGIRNLDYDLYRKIKIPIRNIEEQKGCINTIEEIEKNRKSLEVEKMLKEALICLNPEIRDLPERADEVIYKLRAILLSVRDIGLVRANEEFTRWLQGDKTMPFGENNQHVPVRLIDFENLTNNSFIATNQFRVTRGVTKIPDMVLLINGMPVIIGEFKTPVRPAISWLDGAVQIHDDYEKSIPELFVTNIFSFATEGKTFRYGSIRMPLEIWGPWRDDSRNDKALGELFGFKEVEIALESMFKPSVILDILEHFTIFATDKKNRRIKIISRYQQYNGANMIVKRVKEGMVKKGLIWHFQGSGKSLLMVFCIFLWADRYTH